MILLPMILPIPGRAIPIRSPDEIIGCMQCGAIVSPQARAYILLMQGWDLTTHGIDCPCCHFPFAIAEDWVSPEFPTLKAHMDYASLVKEIRY